MGNKYLSDQFKQLQKQVALLRNSNADNDHTQSESGKHYSDRFKQLQKQVATQLSADVDENYINSFLTDSREFALQTEADSKALTWATATSQKATDERNTSAQAMKDRATKVRAWFSVNRDSITQDAYRQYTQYLDDFGTFQEQSAASFRNSQEKFAQFETESDYNAYLATQEKRNEYSDKSYTELQKIIGGLSDGAEKEWLLDYADTKKTKDDWEKELSYSKAELTHLRQLRSERDRLIEFQAMSTATPEYYDLKKRWDNYHNQFDNLDERIKKLEEDLWWFEREEKYKSLPENEDFEELSRKDPPFMDWTYVAVNDPTKARRWETAAFIHGVAPVYDAINYDNLHYMNAEERAIFNYLYAKEGEKSAKEYLEYLQYELNKRSSDFWNKGVADLTQKKPVLSQTIASLLSTPVALQGGHGLANAFGQKIKSSVTGEYKPIDYNRDAMIPAQLSDTIRDTVEQNIADADWGKGGFLPALYRLAMDVLDFATGEGLKMAHPAAEAVASGILTDTAATQAMLDAAERGATDEQALTDAALSVFYDMFFGATKLGSLLKAGGSFLENLSD